MRNYSGYPVRKDREGNRTRLIIEDNTIYEIDLDCCDRQFKDTAADAAMPCDSPTVRNRRIRSS